MSHMHFKEGSLTIVFSPARTPGKISQHVSHISSYTGNTYRHEGHSLEGQYVSISLTSIVQSELTFLEDVSIWLETSGQKGWLLTLLGLSSPSGLPTWVMR